MDKKKITLTTLIILMSIVFPIQTPKVFAKDACEVTDACRADSDCAAGQICVVDSLDRDLDQCVYNCTCRPAQTIALGTVDLTKYCVGAWSSGGFNGGGVGSNCGDQAYIVPNNPDGNLCVRYSTYDQDNSASSLYLTYNQSSTEWDTQPPSENDTWRYNYIRDVDDATGNFFQLEIRSYDTGFADFMYGYLLTPSGATDGAVSTACCPSANNCVYGSVQGNNTGTAEDYGCYSTGQCHNTGSTDSLYGDEYCDAGTWRENDTNSTTCETCLGAGKWNIGGEVTPGKNKCCGDDAGEYDVEVVTDSTLTASPPSTYDACCDSSSDCAFNSTCYSNGTITVDVDGNGDNDYCNNGVWSDCSTTAQCGVGKKCSGGDCVDCAATDCLTISNCRSGSSVCCGPTGSPSSATDYDTSCAANQVCVLDQINTAPDLCAEAYQCRAVETLVMGVPMNDVYSSGISGTGGGAGSGCGDHGYYVSGYNNATDNLCIRFNIYDAENTTGIRSIINHNTSVTNTNNTSNNYWRCNVIRDIPDTPDPSGNFIQLEIRNNASSTDDTAFTGVMFGYYINENNGGGDTDGGNSQSCCDQATDCVYNGGTNNQAGACTTSTSNNTTYDCYDSGQCVNNGSAASPNANEYCDNGVWRQDDYSSTACACLGTYRWNLGGDVAATTCCGDDNGENRRQPVYDGGGRLSDAGETLPAVTLPDDYACCDSTNDCVFADTCTTTGNAGPDVNADGDSEYCLSGTWYDCNDDTHCNAGEICNGVRNCVPSVLFYSEDDDPGEDTNRDLTWNTTTAVSAADACHDSVGGSYGDYGDRCGNASPTNNGVCIGDGSDGICQLLTSTTVIIDGSNNDGVWDSTITSSYVFANSASVPAGYNGFYCTIPSQTTAGGNYVATFTADQGGGSWYTTYTSGPGTDGVTNDADTWIDETFRWDQSEARCVECDPATRQQAISNYQLAVGSKSTVRCESACGAPAACDDIYQLQCNGETYCDTTCSAADKDSNQTYCEDSSGCTARYWNIGGEIAATTCCGDDTGENRKVSTYVGITFTPGPAPSTQACCDNSNDCNHGTGATSCYTTGTYIDVNGDGDNERCYNGSWYDCRADTDCPAGQYCETSTYSCTACGINQCRTIAQCRNGSFCCDNDPECGAGRICINDNLSASQTVCYYGYSCRNVETLPLGTIITDKYSAGLWQPTDGFTGNDAASNCGDHAYYVPAGTDVCLRYSAYDANSSVTALITSYNHNTSETNTSPASGNLVWKYNYIRDVPETAGGFVQLEIRTWDTGFSDVMLGELKTELGATDGVNSTACCPNASDCADDSVNGSDTNTVADYGCYTNGTCRDTGSTASVLSPEYCANGTWVDNDASQAACDSCLGVGRWDLGGDITTCCGDDVTDYERTCSDYSSQADCGADTIACCDTITDCVDDSGSCQTAGACYGAGVFGNSFCNSTGSWRNPDEDQAYCHASCDMTLSDNGIGWTLGGDISNCCGDDSAEYDLLSQYNAATLDPAPGATTDACCSTDTKCVHADNCYTDGTVSIDVDGDTDNDYCNSGTWYDCKTNSQCLFGYKCEFNECVPRPAPDITSLTPNSGVAGTQVVITGVNFGASQGSSTIKFNGRDALVVVSWTTTSITVEAPRDVTSGYVVITVDDSPSPSEADSYFTVNTPAISSLTPSNGYWLDTIIIDGSNFGKIQGDSYVEFTSGVSASCSSWGDTSLTCTVPIGCASGHVKVHTSGGISAEVAGTTEFALTTDNSTWPFDPPTDYDVSSTDGAVGGGLAYLKSNNSPPWYDFNWKYRRKITIDNTGGGALTNYQQLVELDASFSYSNTQTDGDDIRFTSSDGTTILAYWEESYASPSGRFWVKVPSIAANSTTDIYMYYGNVTAGRVSDFENTMDVMQWKDGDPAWTKVGSSSNADYSTTDAKLAMQSDLTARTCSLYWDSNCGLPDEDDNTTGPCSNHGNNTSQEKVIEVTLNKTKVAIGGTVNVTCNFDAKNGSAEYIYYNDGSGWTQKYSGVSGSNQVHSVTQTITVSGNAGAHWVRCIIDSDGENDECADVGTRYDNDDVNFFAYYESSGQITGTDITGFMRGISLSANHSTTPPTTDLNYSIIKTSDGSTLCTINAAQAAAGYTISSCAANYSSVKAKVALTTSSNTATPEINDWTVDYYGRQMPAVTPTATVGAESVPTYYTTDPIVKPILAKGKVYEEVIAFREIPGPRHTGTTKYQISNNGTNWYYWNGSNWVAETGGGYAQANTAADINTNVKQFDDDVGIGTFYFRAIMHSNGTEAIEIDGVSINVAQVSITEVQYWGNQTGEGDEFIQIYNPYSSDYLLDNHFVGDGENEYSFGSSGEVIPANFYYLLVRDKAIFNSRFNCDNDKVHEWAAMDLDNAGDEIYLRSTALPGESVDVIVYGSYDQTDIPEGAFTIPPGSSAPVTGVAGRSLRRISDGWEGNEKDTSNDADASPENEEQLANNILVANPPTPFCEPPRNTSFSITDTAGHTNDSTPKLSMNCEDPAGIDCNSADWMRIACSEADLATAVWIAFEKQCNEGGYSCTFDMTSGPGCNASEGSKTLWIEFKDEKGNIQHTHNSDTTFYDATPPTVSAITVTSDKETYFCGTSDGCTTINTTTGGTAYFNNNVGEGDAQKMTVEFTWSDGPVGSVMTQFLGGTAFSENPTYDGSTVGADTNGADGWKQTYNINNGEGDQNNIAFTVYDLAGNYTTVNITFLRDNAAPTFAYNDPTAGGDSDWFKNSTGAEADVDFIRGAGGSPLALGQFRVGAGAWTDIFSSYQPGDYTTGLDIWSATAEGVSEIGLKATDGCGNTATHPYISGATGFRYRKDLTDPVISSVLVTSDREDYFFGTSDSLICNVSLYPAVTCQAWFNSLAGEGGGQNVTVTVAWTDNLTTDNLTGENAFSDIPPPDTTPPLWTVTYSVEDDTTDQTDVDFTVSDSSTRTDAIKIDFLVDNTDPSMTFNNPASGAWKGADFDIDISDSDAGSGLKTCEFKVESNNGAWVTTQAWAARTCNSATSASITVGAAAMCRD